MKILFLGLCLFSTLLVCFASDKIKLSEVKTLTLYANHNTNGRRSRGVPQLECIGGTANCDRKYTPTVVQCSNAGSDGYDVQWTCKAELEKNVKFGTIDVSCEGYDYPNDQYILKGSCGLRYSLDRKSSHDGQAYNDNNKRTLPNESNSNFMIIILIVVVVIIIVCVYNTSQNTPRGTATAPPPPGFRPEYTEQHGYTAPPPYSSVFNNTKTGTQTNDGPGFWTGLGAGGLMGYFFGSSTTTRRRGYEPMAPSYGYRDTNSGYQDSNYGSSAPSRSRSTSPTFRTAEGYGGTSRR